jgi:hypothetical protein
MKQKEGNFYLFCKTTVQINYKIKKFKHESNESCVERNKWDNETNWKL